MKKRYKEFKITLRIFLNSIKLFTYYKYKRNAIGFRCLWKYKIGYTIAELAVVANNKFSIFFIQPRPQSMP